MKCAKWNWWDTTSIYAAIIDITYMLFKENIELIIIWKLENTMLAVIFPGNTEQTPQGEACLV